MEKYRKKKTKIEVPEKTIEEYYTEEEYEKIVNRRKLITAGVILLILFLVYNFFMFQNRKIDTDKIVQEKIEKLEVKIREQATKEAEQKAKMEMEAKLQEEIEKIRLEEAEKRVITNSEISQVLDKLPKGAELEKLVKEAKKAGKTVEELLAEKEKEVLESETSSSFGENVNKFISGVYDFFSNLINGEDSENK